MFTKEREREREREGEKYRKEKRGLFSKEKYGSWLTKLLFEDFSK